MEMEMECMKVYRSRVDETSKERAHLHQLLAANEAELSALVACLGENDLPLKVSTLPLSAPETEVKHTTEVNYIINLS